MNKEVTFDDAVYDPIISLTPQETRMFFNKYYLVTQKEAEQNKREDI